MYSYNINVGTLEVGLPFAFASKETCTVNVCKDINEFKLLTNVPELSVGHVTRTLAKINRSQFSTFGVTRELNMHTVYKLTPLACKFYNKNMGAIDSMDRLLESYQLQRRTQSFQMSFHYYYLNMVTVNSFYLYQLYCNENDIVPITHLKYRDQLINKLLSYSSGPANETTTEDTLQVTNRLAVPLTESMNSWIPLLLKKKNRLTNSTRINKRSQPRHLKPR